MRGRNVLTLPMWGVAPSELHGCLRLKPPALMCPNECWVLGLFKLHSPNTPTRDPVSKCPPSPYWWFVLREDAFLECFLNTHCVLRKSVVPALSPVDPGSRPAFSLSPPSRPGTCLGPHARLPGAISLEELGLDPDMVADPFLGALKLHLRDRSDSVVGRPHGVTGGGCGMEQRDRNQDNDTVYLNSYGV